MTGSGRTGAEKMPESGKTERKEVDSGRIAAVKEAEECTACALYHRLKSQFEKAGLPEPEADAWELFSFVTGMSRASFYAEPDRKLSKEQNLLLKDLADRRLKRIPVQHLTGSVWFMGLEFAVSEAALIPRQDTEHLVETAMQGLKKEERVLDLCTGSGCIAISLALLAKARVTASDISAEALRLAKENARHLDAEVEFVRSDLFEYIPGKFTCIVSNPPYIASAVIGTLMPEVREHEPLLALDGGQDGLDFYKRIVREAPEHLEEGGRLCLEIGFDQGDAVQALMIAGGFEEVSVKKDYAGLDRVVSGVWSGLY